MYEEENPGEFEKSFFQNQTFREYEIVGETNINGIVWYETYSLGPLPDSTYYLPEKTLTRFHKGKAYEIRFYYRKVLTSNETYKEIPEYKRAKKITEKLTLEQQKIIESFEII